MSIANFKPSVWEQALITAWRGVSVTELITTPPSEIKGEKAIFTSLIFVLTSIQIGSAGRVFPGRQSPTGAKFLLE